VTNAKVNTNIANNCTTIGQLSTSGLEVAGGTYSVGAGTNQGGYASVASNGTFSVTGAVTATINGGTATGSVTDTKTATASTASSEGALTVNGTTLTNGTESVQGSANSTASASGSYGVDPSVSSTKTTP
jgi:hypothetical protein